MSSLSGSEQVESENPYRSPATIPGGAAPKATDQDPFALPKRSMAFYFVATLLPILMEGVLGRDQTEVQILGYYVAAVIVISFALLALQGVLATFLSVQQPNKLARRVAGRGYLFVGAMAIPLTIQMLMEELVRF